MKNQLLATISEGVYRREYSLLLGAGASIGSLGGDDTPLPSGPQLRDILVREFEIPTQGQQITLQRAYTAAKRKNPQRLEHFIRRRFTNCTPAWHNLIAETEWHRIWTLNIDDTVEQAFRAKAIDFDRFNWTSRFRDSASSDRQIIHLHGFAKDPRDSDTSESDVVFSISEYISTIHDRRPWHAVFRDEFAERPTIIIGASLVDEFDLQQALQSSGSTATRGFPSVIVLNEISQLEREELHAYGLTVVESDAEVFMRRLYGAVAEHRHLIESYYDQVIDDRTSRFLQQFIDLRNFRPQASRLTRNFYEGYEPHWRNILDEEDAVFGTTVNCLRRVREDCSAGDVQQGVHVLTGTRGTGKTAGLLRIAKELIGDGLFVFLFRGDEHLDIDATVQWLSRNPRTVLIFDDCGDFAAALGILAETCAAREISLVVVAGARSARVRLIEQKVDGKYLSLLSEYTYSDLSDSDIVALTDKLDSRRRLGHITRHDRRRRHSYFRVTAARQLFEGMANLELGSGFRQRLSSEFRQIVDTGLRNLYSAACVSYYLGHPIPLGIASNMAGRPPDHLIRNLESSDFELLLLDANGVRPPHRLTAELVIRVTLDVGMRFDAMLALTLSLAPHVDVGAMRNQTRACRLVRRLMAQSEVTSLLQETYGRRYYELLEESYDWNGRYWEQRALFESDYGNHPRARSYAEYSLRIHEHAFAFNTLGTVLGRFAIETGSEEMLRDSIANLTQSRRRPVREESQYPFVTLFSTMIAFAQRWEMSAIPPQIRDCFFEWHGEARRSNLFGGSRWENQLEKFLQDWLYLLARRT